MFFVCIPGNTEPKDQDQKSNDKKNESGTDNGNLLAEIPFYLEIFETNKKEEIKINAFYFINHFMVNILSGFDLLDKLKNDDREYIIEGSYRALSNKTPVNLMFNNYKSKNKLAFSFSIISKEKKDYLLILSNFDLIKKDVLSLDTPREKRKDCFSAVYLISGDKLVNENHFYSIEVERELKKSGDLNNLADFYLFDEKTENDPLIEGILAQAFKTEKNPDEKLQTSILLSLYYMMSGKLDLAGSALDSAKSILDKNMNGKKDVWEKALEIQREEIVLINKLESNTEAK